MRTLTVWSAIVESFETMLERGNQSIRVVGPAPGGAQFIEVVIDEVPLRKAMYRFSRNLLLVSLGIAILAAGLVYLALHYLFVRPMRRLTANLVGFHENPESAARIIVPSQRGDEIGVAERELSDMQRDLVSMLSQKSRLAALGLAVSKINHDLRNLLASSQLLSDQLASVPDPRVQRFAPKLMRSLERAIDFCQSTLSYGRAQEAEAGSIVTVTSGGRPTGVVNEAALLATPEDRRPWVAVSTVARTLDDGLRLPVGIRGEELVLAISRNPASE